MPKNRYSTIIERIFFNHFQPGDREVFFEREEIEHVAAEMSIKLPKNQGDIIYSFRYRANLPDTVLAEAPPEHTWVIRPAGRSRYTFAAILDRPLIPQVMLAQTKVPDATPGIVARYSLNDEQALLARVRYNRLIDIFSGVICYSLQNHLRTTVEEMGQVEIDEIYVGVDRRGAQYVFPVQAKTGNDRLNIVQIEQDFAVCAQKFPNLICHAVAAQFMKNGAIALFGFEMGEEGVALTDEKHYKLVPPEDVTDEELETYRNRPVAGHIAP